MTRFLEVLRAINVPLLMVTAFAVAVRTNDYWADLSRGRRLVYGGVVVFIANGAVGSSIKYVTHAPVDISIAITTAISATILLGVWMSRHESKPPPNR